MFLRRLISVSALCLGLAGASNAQLRIIPHDKVVSVAQPQLSRDSAALNFDTGHIVAEPMSEDDSPRNYVYRFRNVGEDKIQILRLVTTCSCMTATCTRPEVHPGETSEIVVRYNPKGHPGKFERKVFVYTRDGDSPSAVLKLTAEVTTGKDLSAQWPVQMGQIRLRRSEVTFEAGRKAVETLRFINLGDRPLRLECEKAFLPECLTFTTEPEVVQGGAEGQIRISYDPLLPGIRDDIHLILKGLSLPPSKSAIKVKLLR